MPYSLQSRTMSLSLRSDRRGSMYLPGSPLMASFRASALWLFFARVSSVMEAIKDGDMVWWGWEEAVIRLGATEFEPTLKRVWTKVIFDQHEA